MKKSSLKSKAIRAIDGTPGEVTYGLRYIDRTSNAYFTVTAWFMGKNRRGQWQEFGGCCHEYILSACPELKPLVNLHLSDEDGWPMHLYANARFHAGIGKWSGFAPRCLANHLRISDEAADSLANSANETDLNTFIDSQLDRYEAEARAAIKQFELR